jgi:transcriptional regulator with PAS, ATPase and Fis domain
MKSDMNDLKKLVLQIMEKGPVNRDIEKENEGIIKKLYSTVNDEPEEDENLITAQAMQRAARDEEQIFDTEEIVEESLSLEEKEIELIRKALGKHNGKRKYAAKDLGISERTLYRKIKEYSIE